MMLYESMNDEARGTGAQGPSMIIKPAGNDIHTIYHNLMRSSTTH